MKYIVGLCVSVMFLWYCLKVYKSLVIHRLQRRSATPEIGLDTQDGV